MQFAIQVSNGIFVNFNKQSVRQIIQEKRDIFLSIDVPRSFNCQINLYQNKRDVRKC